MGIENKLPALAPSDIFEAMFADPATKSLAVKAVLREKKIEHFLSLARKNNKMLASWYNIGLEGSHSGLVR
jgi:hypothetical protein